MPESSCGAGKAARFGRVSNDAEPADLAIGRVEGRPRTGVVGDRVSAGDEMRGWARAVELERVNPAAGGDEVSGLDGNGTRVAEEVNRGRI
jgi:hypothetical protein